MTASSGWLIVAVGLCAFLIGLSKGGLGGTAVTLITPTLALVMPAPDAVGIALPMLLVGDFFALWAYWRAWDRRVVLRMLPGTIVGIIVGSLLLGVLPSLTIRHFIGIFALAYCAYKLIAPRLRQELTQTQVRSWQAPVFTSMAGLASTMGNAGGPIADAYVLMEHLTPITFIGTEALYFALVNAMKLPGFLSAGVLRLESFLQILWAIPLIPLGVWVGKRMIHRTDIRIFDWIVFILLLIAAVVLLVR